MEKKVLTSTEIRSRFLAFFEERGHAILLSASLVPENDPSVLFNTAGMQPLVPYLMGERHPSGVRLASIQKCVRTGDIDEVGDSTHLTFFEMMGNWSLGDYFKQEAIEWSFDLLTNSEYGFALDPQRLYVTCFEGNDDAPRDEESADIWREIFKKHGVTGERVYFLPAKNNWWSPGDNGPCGPDTEMFYDLTGKLTHGMTFDEYKKTDEDQKVVEIWNDVFMEYVKKDGKVVGKLENKNVDTGSGFERVVTVVQGKNNVYETDIWTDTIMETRNISDNQKSERVIADHLRTAVFMIADGVTPSNTDRGYILRRLIRRAVFNTKTKKISKHEVQKIVATIIKKYDGVYENVVTQEEKIISEIVGEAEKFEKTVVTGLKRITDLFKKENNIDTFALDNNDLFDLYQSSGFPVELSLEEIDRERVSKGLSVIDNDLRKKYLEKFNEEMKKHQELSRAGAEHKFKGGMGGTGEVETRYHTATHLLHQALRDVLGTEVSQKGSNITAERLRFDFSFPRKMTDEEKKRVEDIVNEKIALKMPMQKVVMKKADAEKTGALHFFGDKYGDEVNVYFIGDDIETAYSKEFCGGPHVTNLSELGHFMITKEEAVSAGVRRIKAILD